MHRKIIILFLLAASAVTFLPAQSKAAVPSETVAPVNAAAPAATLFLQTYRSRNRRWRFRARNRNYGFYRSRWNRNRRMNRRENRWERRDDRRDRRRDRREDRRDRRDRRN